MNRLFILTAVAMLASATSQAQYGSGNTRVGIGQEKQQRGQTVTGTERPVGSFTTYSQTGTTETKSASAWDDISGMYSLSYTATFEHADKGEFGIAANSFGNRVGLSMFWSGIYSLAAEKFFDTNSFGLGFNLNSPLGDGAIFYMPLHVTMSQIGGSQKLYWGAMLTPTLGLRSGKVMLSFGWPIGYSFKSEEFNAKSFMINLGFLEL